MPSEVALRRTDAVLEEWDVGGVVICQLYNHGEALSNTGENGEYVVGEREKMGSRSGLAYLGKRGKQWRM